MSAVEAVALGVDVHLTSAATGDGLDALDRYTASGAHRRPYRPVGRRASPRSINAMLGEERQATHDIRHGRRQGSAHHRRARAGPAARRRRPHRHAQAFGHSRWSTPRKGIAAAFPDIEALAAAAASPTVGHEGEPGCAVLAAVESGDLPRSGSRATESWSASRATRPSAPTHGCGPRSAAGGRSSTSRRGSTSTTRAEARNEDEQWTRRRVRPHASPVAAEPTLESYAARHPPSAITVAPLMNRDRSETRNSARFAMSTASSCAGMSA